MKKILALAIAVVMLLSLCACGYTDQMATISESLSSIASSLEAIQASLGTPAPAAEQTTQPAEASTTAAATAQPAATDFKWNGQTEVWSVLPTTNAQGLVMINDAMGAMLQANGWTYVKKDAQGDPAAQVTYIEDAIAAGTVGAIMCAAMSVEMLQNVVQDANNAGIIVIYLGAEPTTYSIGGCVYTAYELTGMQNIKMAEAWAQDAGAQPDSTGKIPVALDTYDDIVDGRYRSNAMRDCVASSDTLYKAFEGVNYGDDAQNSGYTWAEDCMTANPDLRIFCCYEPDAAYGVCNYLQQYCSDNSLDLKDFCVIWCYEDTDSPSYLLQAQSDPSSTAAKGYVTYGGTPWATGARLGEEILGLAYGTTDSWPAGADATYANISTVMSDTYGMDPAATAVTNVINGYTWGTSYYDQINAWCAFGDYDQNTFNGSGSMGLFYHWEMGMENPATQYKY